MTRCMVCHGTGWQRRIVPHPFKPDHTISVSKPCRFCGKDIRQSQLDFDVDKLPIDTEPKIK